MNVNHHSITISSVSPTRSSAQIEPSAELAVLTKGSQMSKTSLTIPIKVGQIEANSNASATAAKSLAQPVPVWPTRSI
jgi:hypothetical protein